MMESDCLQHPEGRQGVRGSLPVCQHRSANHTGHLDLDTIVALKVNFPAIAHESQGPVTACVHTCLPYKSYKLTNATDSYHTIQRWVLYIYGHVVYSKLYV